MSVLAELMEVSPQTLTNWKKRGVSKEGSLKASDALGASASYIWEDIGPPFPEASSLQVPVIEPIEVSVGLATMASSIAEACQQLNERDRDVIADSIRDAAS